MSQTQASLGAPEASSDATPTGVADDTSFAGSLGIPYYPGSHHWRRRRYRRWPRW